MGSAASVDNTDAQGEGSWCSRALVFLLFVYQNSSVQLLYTQHWSFLGSVLTEQEGAVWFAPIAGLGSVSSTLAVSFAN